MLEHVRQSKRYFAVLTAAALLLRLLFYFRFSLIQPDGFLYGDIAKNWLQHGIFGISAGLNAVTPTYIRLPGYPGFLAICFALFGMEHYHAVMLVQVVFDIGTCFVVADLARRTVSDRAARLAFLLSALNPFLANYVATPLTETLAVFCAAAALDGAVIGLDAIAARTADPSSFALPAFFALPGVGDWVACGLSLAYGILLRPDGGILLAVVGAYLVILAGRRPAQRKNLLLAAVLVSTIAVAPLAPWTIRNWRVFHRFEPLAPRYANGPDEVVPMGFERWVKTWMADYVSVSEVYWNLGEEQIDIGLLPNRAFDSPRERQRTQEIFEAYNQTDQLSPELDRQLAQLAAERIGHAPWRYYVWLPALRIADMWLRPRTEILGVGMNYRWWELRENPGASAFAIAWGLLNLFLVVAALAALLRPSVVLRYPGLLLGFVVVRSLFLGSLENPEPRYVLECFPVLLVLAAAGLIPGKPRAVFSPAPCRPISKPPP